MLAASWFRLAPGLADDTRLGGRLPSYPLESIRAPTLIVTARDDGFGTFAGARDMASRIADARFVGHGQGGHLLVGHGAQTSAAIAAWVASRR